MNKNLTTRANFESKTILGSGGNRPQFDVAKNAPVVGNKVNISRSTITFSLSRASLTGLLPAVTVLSATDGVDGEPDMVQKTKCTHQNQLHPASKSPCRTHLERRSRDKGK